MKVRYLTVALLLLLGLWAVSCQKEIVSENQNMTNTIGYVRYMHYSVDGVPNVETIIGDYAWAEFLERMRVLAENGHTVSFSNSNRAENTSAVKETVTFQTDDPDEADEWAGEMADAGYVVTIIFDKKTGIYTCIAVK